METVEVIIDLLSGLAALAAVVVAVLALQTYRDLRPAAQLKRSQDRYFIRLSAEIMLIFQSLLTFWDCLKRQEKPDPYLFPIYLHNTRQLHKILNKSADHELTHEVVGDHNRRWERHLAFRSALLDQSTLDLESSQGQSVTVAEQLQPVFSYHFLLGLIDLACICIEYEDNLLKEDLAAALSEAKQSLEKLLAVAVAETGTLWE